jgi:hypothetical protein
MVPIKAHHQEHFNLFYQAPPVKLLFGGVEGYDVSIKGQTIHFY